MYHYPDLDSASVASDLMAEANSQPIRSTTQTWGVMIHQYGISALVPQTSFCPETSGGVTKCWLQSQANNNWFHHKNCIWEMRVTKCWLQDQANYWCGKVWNGWFQKISIPYHRWHEYFNPPLPSEIPKCLSPLALRIPKSLTPPLLRNFPLLFQTLWNSCSSA